MDEITVNLPPEVCGVLYHARRHLEASKNPTGRNGYRRRACRERHVSKAQKLIAVAWRLLGESGLTSLLSQCKV